MPLGPQTPDATIRSVSELVLEVQETLRADFEAISVQGEISNLKQPSSGHVYLTLKDDGAQLRAVLWRSVADRVRGTLTDGVLVVARGSLTVYEPRGDLQMVVSSLTLSGEGELQRAFEALKRRLAAEGLFDPARKRTLPPYPRTIGIVTSGTGAVIRDMLSIIGRRYPAAHVVIAPVRVQGDWAAEEIAEAIRRFNRLLPSDGQRPDVLIVGRGGGSMEDLQAFNEEVVARAIHASGIPVVSAVGHETDFTIADLVADVRAGTPSMAAEMAVPSSSDLDSAVRARVEAAAQRLGRIVDRLRHRLESTSRAHAFHSPRQRLDRLAQRNDELTMRLDRAMDLALRRAVDRSEALANRVRVLDPLRPLGGGFALVRHGGEIVRSATLLAFGDRVDLRFVDGSVEAVVTPSDPGGS